MHTKNENNHRITTDQRSDLAAWLTIYKSAKGVVAGLVILGTFQAALIYFDLLILSKFVASIFPRAQGQVPADPWLDPFFNALATMTGIHLIYVLLGIYCVGLACRAIIVFSNEWLSGLLRISSQNDIEREVFRNLLRKDEQFFQHHSVSEITNRLAMDIAQVVELRLIYVGLWFAFMTIAGSVYFFIGRGYMIAAIGVGTIVMGVVVSNFLQRAMPVIQGRHLAADDAVKSTFEQYMTAAPEIQIRNLHEFVIGKFRIFQNERFKVFMQRTSLQGKLGMNYTISYMISFLCVVFVILLTGKPQLIAAVIRAFPELHGNISDVGRFVMQIKLSAPSVTRLMEYASPQLNEDGIILDLETSSVVPDIHVDHVNYRYNADKPLMGGADGINVVIPARKLIALVGGSGSGKSTLSQMLMGLMQPERGKVSVDSEPVSSISVQSRAKLFAYMPQSNVMLDASISENLRFGDIGGFEEANASTPLDETALTLLTEIGVSHVALSKALEMFPARDTSDDPGDGTLQALREKIQARVSNELNVCLQSFDEGGAAPGHPLVYHLLNASLDARELLKLANSKAGMNRLKGVLSFDREEKLMEIARAAMGGTLELLFRFRDVNAYNRVAPVALEAENWALRSNLAHFVQMPNPPDYVKVALSVIGLLVSPLELPDDRQVSNFLNSVGLPPEALRILFENTLSIPVSAFDADRINPKLNWHDNLLFAVMTTPQPRKNTDVDRIILECVKDTPLQEVLTHCGFSYRVGKGGRRLSGGQRQMVCLGRTLLSKAMIYILDEPSSALDPLSRSRVHKYLKDYAQSATVIVITHDPNLAEMADEVMMMRDGMLHASGPYDQLSRDNTEFKNVISGRNG